MDIAIKTAIERANERNDLNKKLSHYKKRVKSLRESKKYFLRVLSNIDKELEMYSDKIEVLNRRLPMTAPK